MNPGLAAAIRAYDDVARGADVDGAVAYYGEHVRG